MKHNLLLSSLALCLFLHTSYIKPEDLNLNKVFESIQSCILNNSSYFFLPDILVQNIAPVIVISVPTIISTVTPIVKTCLLAGITLLGSHFAKKVNRKQRLNTNTADSSPNNCNSPNPDPNDPNDDKKKTKSNEHPHGIYKNAPYHQKNPCGNKSKRPDDGQHCLDYSIRAGKQRVAIEGDEFVVLRYTQPGEYHGFKVSWKDLEDSLRSALMKNGFVRKSGKIIRQITEKFPS